VTISFARGIPGPDLLPVDELADCAQAALRDDGRTILSYGSTLGYQPLREWIGERHGVEPGRVLVERPTYDRPRRILAAEGRELGEVPLDEDGLNVDELEGVYADGDRLLYTIPTFQNPTGVALSEERRRRLATFAGERGLRVLEDDPYGLVRFEGAPLPTLLELEGGEHVLYSSSFSKTVAPGLRVGYLIVPPALAAELEPLVASTYITPALLAQATVHEFFRRGLFEPNLERVCGLLRERRDAMLEALDRELAGRAGWNRPDGGYFLWLELADGADSTELLGVASEAGVTFVPGPDFGGPANSLRLAFSFVSPAEIDDGVTRLARLVAPVPAAVELG